jgi:MPBQ/MSBQ methyltransferase
VRLVPPYLAELLVQRDPVEPGSGGRGRFLHLGHFDRREAQSHDALLDAQVRLNDEVLRLADLPESFRLLDVGCGIGGTLAEVALRRPRADLVGLNIDPEQLRAAASIAAPTEGSLAWVVADACSLPFADGSFDRVLAVECLFHFVSRARFFAEAARVLAPGGRLVVTDIVARLADDAIAAIVARGLGPWPDLYCREGEHAELAERAGLFLEEHVDATRSTEPSWEYFDDGERTTAMHEAVSLLARLHREGALRVLYAAFVKRPQPQ